MPPSRGLPVAFSVSCRALLQGRFRVQFRVPIPVPCWAVLGLVTGAVWAVGAGPTQARARTPFHIPAGSTREGLIALALQADVNLVDPDVCHGRTEGVTGVADLGQALAVLLRGADCRFDMPDASTVRLRPLAPRPLAPHPLPDGGARRAAALAGRNSPGPEDKPPARLDALIVTSLPGEFGAPPTPGTTVLPGVRLLGLGVAGPSDLVGLAAGLTSTNLGPGRDKLMLRGLSDGAFAGEARVGLGIYLGRVPLTFDAPDPDLRLADVERIDITRGPQGAMFGAGEPEGALRVIPNPPELDRRLDSIDLTWAETRRGGDSHAAQAMLNLPLKRDRIGLRWVAYDEVDGGFGRAGPRQAENLGRTVRRGGRLALRLDMDGGWQATLSAAAQRLATSDARYYLRAPRRAPRRAAQDVAESHRDLLDEWEARLDGAGAWGRLWASLAYVSRSYATVYDAAGAQVGDQALATGAYYEPRRMRLGVAQIAYASPTVDPLSLEAGIYLADLEGAATPVLTAPPLGRWRPFAEQRSDEVTDAAAYGRLGWRIGGHWSASVGGRLQLTRQHSVSSVTTARGVQRRQWRDQSARLMPSLSIQRTLPAGGGVYVLYAEADRPGGLNSPGLARSAVPATFGADRLQNLEVGLTLVGWGGRGQLRGELFHDRWRNIQVQDYTRRGGLYAANLGEATDDGLGLEVRFRPAPRLTLGGEAQLDKASLADRAHLRWRAARGLPGTPAVSAGVTIDYSRPMPAGMTLLASGRAAYVGRSHLTLDARSPRMGGYVEDRISVGLGGARWSATVFVDNLADSQANTFAFGNPFSFGRGLQVTPQRGRTIGLEISARP